MLSENCQLALLKSTIVLNRFKPVVLKSTTVISQLESASFYFISKLDFAFRSTFSENSKIRHGTAFQCYYCSNW